VTSKEIGPHIEGAVDRRMRLQFKAEQYAEKAFESFDWGRAIVEPAYIETFFAQVGMEILKRYGAQSFNLGGQFAERLN